MAVPKEGESCQPGTLWTLPDTDGYISSHAAQVSDAGRRGCPWGIRAEPGQQINISLITFNNPNDINGNIPLG